MLKKRKEPEVRLQGTNRRKCRVKGAAEEKMRGLREKVVDKERSAKKEEEKRNENKNERVYECVLMENKTQCKAQVSPEFVCEV